MATKEELLKQLTDACTRIGFFYVKDHDVPQQKIDQLFKTAEAFFAQDNEKKNEINYKKSRILRGYEPPAEVRTDETRKPESPAPQPPPVVAAPTAQHKEPGPAAQASTQSTVRPHRSLATSRLAMGYDRAYERLRHPLPGLLDL